MNLLGLSTKNILRSPTRTCLTVLGVAMAILVFVLLRTVVSTWDMAADIAAKDRIATRHKLSFVVPLPLHYVDKIRTVPGVQALTWVSWFGGKAPRSPHSSFASYAVDAESFLRVYDELSLPPEQKAAWLADRQGIVIGSLLAKQLGLAVGDRLSLESNIYPGPWPVRVVGIYGLTQKSFDPSSMLLHWRYVNDARVGERQDSVGWVTSRIDASHEGAPVGAAIDRMFEHSGHRTRTMTERELNLSFVARFSAVMQALQAMSWIVLVVLLLLLANTVAMNVRERTSELGTLRALGFRPIHIWVLVVSEAALLGVIAGVVGVTLAVALVNNGIGRFMEENSGGAFPFFRISSTTVVVALAVALFLGVFAAFVPALRMGRLSVVQALRRVD